jgi:Fic family protein
MPFEDIKKEVYKNKFLGLDELDDDLRDMLIEQLVILWTHTSTAIEGNTMSLGETQFIIEQGLSIQGKSIREHNEVIGHTQALTYLFRILNEESITREHILTLHRAVETGVVPTEEKIVGGWKNEKNGTLVTINGKMRYHRFPDPEDIEHLIDLWIKEYGNISNIQNKSFGSLIVRYAAMHLSFAQVHPFFDGNGRVARLISNLPLLRAGYPPIIISNEIRKNYLEIIESYQEYTEPLNSSTTKLLDESCEYYDKFVELCKLEYRNTQNVINDVQKIQTHRNQRK